jgi:hypothetical protein
MNRRKTQAPDVTKPRRYGALFSTAYPLLTAAAASNAAADKTYWLDLQRITVGFERTDTLFELDNVRRRSKVSLTAAAFSGFKPGAQLFNDVCKHDVLQGSDESPVDLSIRDFPIKGLTRIINIRCNLVSEMLE